jgi:hypothetical protein
MLEARRRQQAMSGIHIATHDELLGHDTALISEHTKPAVKNALERFLAAPPPVAPTRTRASRTTRSSPSGIARKPCGTAIMVDAEATRQTLFALATALAEGLSRNAIAELLGVEAGSLTPVIRQLKETGQIEQLGARPWGEVPAHGDGAGRCRGPSWG